MQALCVPGTGTVHAVAYPSAMALEYCDLSRRSGPQSPDPTLYHRASGHLPIVVHCLANDDVVARAGSQR